MVTDAQTIENYPSRRKMSDALTQGVEPCVSAGAATIIIDTHQTKMSRDVLETLRLAVEAYPDVASPTYPAGAVLTVTIGHDSDSAAGSATTFATFTMAAPTAAVPKVSAEVAFPVLPDGERYLLFTLTSTDDWSDISCKCGVAS